MTTLEEFLKNPELYEKEEKETTYKIQMQAESGLSVDKNGKSDIVYDWIDCQYYADSYKRTGQRAALAVSKLPVTGLTEKEAANRTETMGIAIGAPTWNFRYVPEGE